MAKHVYADPTPGDDTDYSKDKSDPSRFGWSGMNQIRPLHADGTPYDEEERAHLMAYKRHLVAERGGDTSAFDEHKMAVAQNNADDGTADD